MHHNFTRSLCSSLSLSFSSAGLITIYIYIYIYISLEPHNPNPKHWPLNLNFITFEIKTLSIFINIIFFAFVSSPLSFPPHSPVQYVITDKLQLYYPVHCTVHIKYLIAFIPYAFSKAHEICTCERKSTVSKKQRSTPSHGFESRTS